MISILHDSPHGLTGAGNIVGPQRLSLKMKQEEVSKVDQQPRTYVCLAVDTGLAIQSGDDVTKFLVVASEAVAGVLVYDGLYLLNDTGWLTILVEEAAEFEEEFIFNLLKLVSEHRLHLDDVLLEVVVENVSGVALLLALTQVDQSLLNDRLHFGKLAAHFKPA